MFCPNPECIDVQESGKPGEYVDGVTVCPKCGTLLVERLDAVGTEDLQLVEGDVEVESVFATADRSEAAGCQRPISTACIRATVTVFDLVLPSFVTVIVCGV